MHPICREDLPHSSFLLNQCLCESHVCSVKALLRYWGFPFHLNICHSYYFFFSLSPPPLLNFPLFSLVSIYLSPLLLFLFSSATLPLLLEKKKQQHKKQQMRWAWGRVENCDQQPEVTGGPGWEGKTDPLITTPPPTPSSGRGPEGPKNLVISVLFYLCSVEPLFESLMCVLPVSVP